ncbi:hypothetical protein BROUX41_001947 [Berkeleyomyces rouxiae]|uniref:uncharacterized protein n=1 Tax=Berkeleyomyces rouxiae TaxID=2035830 RepID=UPI003B80CE25
MARKRAATETEIAEEPKRRISARLRGSKAPEIETADATSRGKSQSARQKSPISSDLEEAEDQKPQRTKRKPAPKAKAAPKPKVRSASPSNKPTVGAGLNSDEDLDPESLPDINPEIERHDGEWYFLMKAEPETRYENGIDVRFSIDDLRARKKPEPWDGIRNYAARNNFKAMNHGDKAFFYHSNTKEPGIVGIMEVVKEYSEDVSARRPGTAYYDPKSTKENPRWGLVHVRFVKKFAVQIGLQELRQLGDQGKLDDMQMLKQTRLSVSRVGQKEFKFLCDLADQKAKAAGLEHIV